MYKTRIPKIIFKYESSFSSFKKVKKFIIILFLAFNLIVLNSCAKPTVLNITLPEDEKSSCEKLEKGVANAQDFRRKALAVTGNTAQNQVRGFLFWPALMMTYVNAQEAIVAANEPVPEPVTSPVSAIVWSPVFVPDKFDTLVDSASEYVFESLAASTAAAI